MGKQSTILLSQQSFALIWMVSSHNLPMPYLSKILLYPIKSLDGVEVSSATVLEGGALSHDREFALFDAEGKVMNAKRTDTIHQIRAEFDLAARGVTLWTEERSPQSFHLDGDRPALNAWFSAFFGQPVTLAQDLHMGFPDDTQASGPTLVSTASLEAVAAWFPAFSLDETRRRFRANLEIAETEPFWEDQLMAEPGTTLPFQIGELTILGSHPCQRCIVPTRDSQTGDRTPQFQGAFSKQRQATLPEWAIASHFNHFYRLTLNTNVLPSEAGKHIHVGDPITVTVPQ